MTPILDVRHLHVDFPGLGGRIEAVRGSCFQIHKGEIVGIVGESGSGKSVTAHAILGLLPKESRIKGEILLEGNDLLIKSDKEMEATRGKKIGMIFQDPYSSLNPTMRIGNQIAEGLIKHDKLSKPDAYKKTVALLDQIGINDPSYRFSQYPHELSGGMRQRVLIAAAIACSPSLLIADEPTTALDMTIQAQILDLLIAIQRQRSMTILIITHDLGVVARLCDRLLVMYGGQIVESGPIEAVFANPRHPYTQGLLKAKQSLALAEEHLYTIPGSLPSLLSPPTRCLFAPRCSSAMRICHQQDPPNEETRGPHQIKCWLSYKERK